MAKPLKQEFKSRIQNEQEQLESFLQLMDDLERRARSGDLKLGEDESWKIYTAADAQGVPLISVTNRLVSTLNTLSQTAGVMNQPCPATTAKRDP